MSKSSNLQKQITDTNSNLTVLNTKLTELNSNIIESVTHSAQITFTSTQADYSFSIPFGKTLMSLSIKRAWPTSNWNNGAIVQIAHVTQVGDKINLSLTTNTVQAYSCEFFVVYK